MRCLKTLLILFATIGFSVGAIAADTEVKVKKIVGEKEELTFNILKLALSKSAPSYKVVEHDEEFADSRIRAELEAGNFSVNWAGASQKNDEQFKTVRIPVLKGMLGHRIFIIKKDRQSEFNAISSFQDLKRMRAGQGTFWGDTAVLKAADLNVVTTLKYPNLFPMLEGERFDYFPRAVHEPWVEVESRPELDLKVDDNVLLIYPFAMYFYVNKNDQKLHDLIYEGLETAMLDGSYDELFFNNPMIKDVLENAHLSTRKVFRIDNPYMHKDTPYDREEFWLDITKL